MLNETKRAIKITSGFIFGFIAVYWVYLPNKHMTIDELIGLRWLSLVIGALGAVLVSMLSKRQ